MRLTNSFRSVSKTGPWYVEWGRPLAGGRSVKHLVMDMVQPEQKILVLGCGNSPMSLDMLEKGVLAQHFAKDFLPAVLLGVLFGEMGWREQQWH